MGKGAAGAGCLLATRAELPIHPSLTPGGARLKTISTNID